MKNSALFFLTLLLLLPAVTALPTITTAEFQYAVEGNAVHAEEQLAFSEPTSAQFDIPLPGAVSDITVTQNSQALAFTLEGNLLRFETDTARALTISYSTQELLDGQNFVTSIGVPLDADMLRVALTLPPQAVLRGTDSRNPAVGAVYPTPSAMLSDGKSLIVRWERQPFPAEEELALYVRYRQSRESQLWLLVLAAVVVIGVLIGLLLFRKRSAAVEQPKPIHQESRLPSKSEPKENDILKHLKEDEQQVVNILTDREGSCEQGTLRVITGFSKAKLSGLLSELEARNIVYKEKRGKKNTVFLRNQQKN